jgi:hypothetical protein
VAASFVLVGWAMHLASCKAGRRHGSRNVLLRHSQPYLTLCRIQILPVGVLRLLAQEVCCPSSQIRRYLGQSPHRLVRTAYCTLHNGLFRALGDAPEFGDH